MIGCESVHVTTSSCRLGDLFFPSCGGKERGQPGNPRQSRAEIVTTRCDLGTSSPRKPLQRYSRGRYSHGIAYRYYRWVILCRLLLMPQLEILVLYRLLNIAAQLLSKRVCSTFWSLLAKLMASARQCSESVLTANKYFWRSFCGRWPVAISDSRLTKPWQVSMWCCSTKLRCPWLDALMKLQITYVVTLVRVYCCWVTYSFTDNSDFLGYFRFNFDLRYEIVHVQSHTPIYPGYEEVVK